MDKSHIISEIRRTAAENDGQPLGIDRFRDATGIRKEDWYGKFWARWSDAQSEAGLEPNQFGEPALDEENMLSKIAEFANELGHIPTRAECQMRKRSDADFPSTTTIRKRLGTKTELVGKLAEHCRNKDGWTAVLKLCTIAQNEFLPKKQTIGKALESDSGLQPGHVYLFKHDQVFKIGRSIDAARRYSEIRIQMPMKTEEVHVIETDDTVGIEAYWHQRFAQKRLEGEWFALNASDVKAFKKRRFM